jgi:predicted enzyme related to lactoylglutathione lyase
MLRGVAVVWMPVENIERAKSFYRDILGLAIQNEDGPWAEVNANELTIGLNGREPGGTAAAGGPVVTFQPEGSLEETVSSLKERGVEVPAEISQRYSQVLNLDLVATVIKPSSSVSRSDLGERLLHRLQ